jgi:hypothetical protein
LLFWSSKPWTRNPDPDSLEKNAGSGSVSGSTTIILNQQKIVSIVKKKLKKKNIRDWNCIGCCLRLLLWEAVTRGLVGSVQHLLLLSRVELENCKQI